MSIITLLTDFGESEYPAMMKGVILKINPSAVIIDITHSISPQSIIEGAFVLKNAVVFFSNGTVHIAVVDPGVGSDRKPIAIKCSNGILIGPDNGLLMPAASLMEIENIFEITNTEFFLTDVSHTFHGRDIFAPVGAALAENPERIIEVGEKLQAEPFKLKIPEPAVNEKSIKATIVHIDRFGNLITNAPRSFLEKSNLDFNDKQSLKIEHNDKSISVQFLQNYSQGKAGKIITLVSSSGHLEIALPNGSAEKYLKAEIGDQITLLID